MSSSALILMITVWVVVISLVVTFLVKVIRKPLMRNGTESTANPETTIR